ncbi:MAG TPA: uroporphyrinogen decarboxylase family protein [Bacteroidota bacterium]|nr:uroporphyrinogen decarboxylase family protein [Bacteroidota bacterium]
MKFNSEDWIQKTLSSKKKHALPIITYPGLQITGKKVIDLVTNGEAQAACVAVLASRYSSLAGVMVMDLSVEAESFGSPIKFNDGEIPTVSGRLIKSTEEIQSLSVPQVGTARTGEYIRAASVAASRVTTKPVFGGMIGPYSLAGRLFDMTEMMMLILTDPDAAHELLKKCTAFLIDYARAYKLAGAAGIVIAEPAAGLLSADSCMDFSSVYVKQIVDAVQDETFIIILHNCGNTVPLVPSMLTTGSAGYHFGNAVDMMDILPQIPKNILAFGNLDPVGIFKMADAASVKSKTKLLLERCKGYNNFVISSGCDVPPGTSLENIDAFYEAIDEFNK